MAIMLLDEKPKNLRLEIPLSPPPPPNNANGFATPPNASKS